MIALSGVKNVYGLCHPIRDLNVALQRRDVAKLRRAGFEIPPGVVFATHDEFERIRTILLANLRSHVTYTPGGPVSNTLHSLASRLGGYPRPFNVHWVGPYAVDYRYVEGDPLESLRRVGVRTICTPGGALCESICLSDADSGETTAIVVGPRPMPSGLGSARIAADDLALIQLSHLPRVLPLLDEARWPGFGIFTADHRVLSEEDRQSIQSLVASDRLLFVFGRRGEFQSLGLFDDQDRPADLIRSAEIVATDSANPVRVYADREEYLLEVSSGGDSVRSLLGAGDAYAGGYLSSRLRSTSVQKAHFEGVSQARLVSYSNNARREYSANLTELFGSFIERASDRPDWQLANRVRQTCGLTVITCGQTGVDQIANGVARSNGLATFAIMPRGNRTEVLDGVGGVQDVLDGIHTLELGSPSYRYCTWANVFSADGTVIFDPADSEGCAETRRACEILNRPLFNATTIDPLEISQLVRDWVLNHGIRVLHVAGNRASRLSKVDLQLTEDGIDRVVRSAAGALGRRQNLSFQWHPRNRDEREVLGVPRLSEVRLAFSNHSPRSIDNLAGPALNVRVGNNDVCFAKSADLVKMLKRGKIDACLVGLDMLMEHGSDDEIEILAESGVFNVLITFLTLRGATYTAERAVAQYPNIAANLIGSNLVQVDEVAGAAEAWVAAGIYDAAIDTWRTGSTADANGLECTRVLASTTLCLAARRGSAGTAVSLGLAVLDSMTSVPRPHYYQFSAKSPSSGR